MILLATALIAVASAVGQGAMAAPVGVASQPGQPKAGFGSNGGCTVTSRHFVNPKWSGEQVYVYQPGGSAAAPTGGGCSGPKRPTVVIAHGTSESDPVSFEGLITHLVSNGNVVVYPTHTMEASDKQTNFDAYNAVRDGMIAAVASTPRADPARIGFWGHSFGGGMVPYLVKQAALRGWGDKALWMSIVAQADSLLVTTPGTRTITVPGNARVMVVSMEHDQMADNRLGIDVFESLDLPYPQKQYVRLHSDAHGQPAIVAEHTAPSGGNGSGIDAIDYTLWRYADILQACAVFQQACSANLSLVGTWSDGTPVTPALVAEHPADSGPYPAALAECDAGYGTTLNSDRIAYCGSTHL
jgi:hypothetical protein